jgi:hypothetical protein
MSQQTLVIFRQNMGVNRVIDLIGSFLAQVLRGMGFFFFQKKKQKALVLLRRSSWDPNLPRSGTTGVWGLAPKKRTNRINDSRIVFFFFQKKKQKALVLLRRSSWGLKLPRSGTTGVWWLASKKRRTIVGVYYCS